MVASVIKMPKLGLEMEQGTVLEWFFEPGDDVSEGDKMAEVESEKSIGEVEAREDGTLRRIFIEEGESVPPGKPIGILAAADAEISDLEAEAEAELEDEAEGDTAAPESSSSDGERRNAAAQATTTSSGGGSSEVKASPRAKKKAEELGVDLTTVDGTGAMDSVTAEDVQAAANEAGGGTDADSVKASPKAKKRAEELGVDLATVDGTGAMDSITAEDVEAAAEATADSADVDLAGGDSLRYQQSAAVADPGAGAALLETTEAVRSAFETRVTITDVLLVVASATLSDRPLVNGTYAESTHQLQESQHVALVTGVNDGPTTTVLPNVDDRSLTDLVDAREDGADSDVTPTFTLANAASVETDGHLVNPPGVAALEVDPAGQRAVPTDDGVDLQPLVTARLTYDTNAIDETEADAFLARFFERAEAASELVLGSYRGSE